MDRESILIRYQKIRSRTCDICKPLQIEDYVIQSMPDVSPPKWHLGHTTWFFERMILQEYLAGYSPFHEQFYTIFNSYYQSLGERIPKDIRGTLSRPLLKFVMAYRDEIDIRIEKLIRTISTEKLAKIYPLIDLGLNHEEQHQELLLTDIKHILCSGPISSIYSDTLLPKKSVIQPKFIPIEEGFVTIGSTGSDFCWDNECPNHKVWISKYEIKNRLITCGEYLNFISDGGYSTPSLWTSEGWEVIQQNGWNSPLYWENRDGEWWIKTLTGIRLIDLDEPITHVSYFEADAFARWSGQCLPTEYEWEKAAGLYAKAGRGNFLESGLFHPTWAEATSDVTQLLGDVWEWTLSSYLPYPGYRQAPPPLGEYNGKFMINQMVLRGGSCASPADHIRLTYRNFFHTDKRWQFNGFRTVKR